MTSKNLEKQIWLSVSEFENYTKDASISVLDLRLQSEFVKRHIPNSLFIGIEGPFDKWIQLLIVDNTAPLLLIVAPRKEQECLHKLNRIGYTNIIGFLQGGINSWVTAQFPTASINSISANTFVIKRESKNIHSIDVRKSSEFDDSHIDDASLIPLAIEKEFIGKFNPNKEYHLFCGGGYRSVLAISYLMKYNVKNVTNIEGGFKAIQNALYKN
jgi:rhodanese-related sulfurtransferase